MWNTRIGWAIGLPCSDVVAVSLGSSCSALLFVLFSTHLTGFPSVRECGRNMWIERDEHGTITVVVGSTSACGCMRGVCVLSSDHVFLCARPLRSQLRRADEDDLRVKAENMLLVRCTDTSHHSGGKNSGCWTSFQWRCVFCVTCFGVHGTRLQIRAHDAVNFAVHFLFFRSRGM